MLMLKMLTQVQIFENEESKRDNEVTVIVVFNFRNVFLKF
jgi:hypothetical protein